MIMTQERSFLKALSQLQALCRLVEQRAGEQVRVDEMERELFASLLAIGRTLLEAFVVAQGDGDAGEEVERDGRRLRRSDEPHARRYLSIFGELRISRFVYAIRAGQKVEHAPLDVQLGLPEGEFSYVLEDWLQRLCVQQSFGEALASLHAWLGVTPSERAAEEMNRRVAADAEPGRAAGNHKLRAIGGEVDRVDAPREMVKGDRRGGAGEDDDPGARRDDDAAAIGRDGQRRHRLRACGGGEVGDDEIFQD